ncbi:hypothetical protein FD02_GL000688 [Lacticaseibacillus nasuensis JCM 17158]|uniref:Uncharacterized protein n=1 Tax=Lacticaseibacillus nasuensis JCM 17158 TaxID=1291734 RepID=A0A0R1JGD0_9LACO|nr:hypothetical protein FD02_GL000688 [Lacticaseibacillus nasuensis JCM 17158]
MFIPILTVLPEAVLPDLALALAEQPAITIMAATAATPLIMRFIFINKSTFRISTQLWARIHNQVGNHEPTKKSASLV